MKNTIMKSAILGLISTALLSACGSGGTNFDDPVKDENYSSGDADLSRYVALGDSLTAGIKDGTLYLDGQLDSFPNILSGLFAEADGGSFTQPLMADNLGGLVNGGMAISSAPARLVLSPNPLYDPNNPTSQQLLPTVQNGTITTDITAPLTPPFNNMGVPGAKSFHLVASNYGNIAGLLATPSPTANPYAVYFGYAASGTSTILTEAITQAPTFFTLWIGNNDILGYATTGGDGTNPITPPTGAACAPGTLNFEDCYSLIVNTMTSGGAKGILINIPSIVDIPFFTRITYNEITLDAATATALNENANIIAYNAGIAGALAASFIDADEAELRTLTFAPGQNPILMIDDELEDLTFINPGLTNLRQALPTDLILLTSGVGTRTDPNDPLTTIGVTVAVEDSDVLTALEIENIENARESYNMTIDTLANNSVDLALFDAAALLADLNDGDGISYGTGNVDSTFATGGAFSLDGVHPTARGYAIIANGIIDTMNTAFNADLPRTDPGNFTEVFFEFPAGFDFSP